MKDTKAVRILALVPARGGSKRIPGKNTRLLGEHPLIVWSIDAAKGLPQICEILVSTDDAAIADIARKAGALVPWLRPAYLATDEASLEDVCLHALDWYEDKHGKVDGLLLLQPTSPFRSKATVQRGIATFEQCKGRLVLGVSPAKSHPMWCLSLEGETLRPFMSEEGLHLRSQDLPAAYVMNGGFYLIAPDVFRQLRRFYSENVVPLVMEDPEESTDIDTEWDWLIAESAVGRRNRKREGS